MVLIKKSFISVGLALMLFTATGAFAYQNPGKPTGFVNDYAGLLDTSSRQTLEGKLAQFEKDASNEISVATITSLNGDTIENFASKLFQDWGIGKKNEDNGVLLLIAKNDKKMRIEVGYGLEGALTDAQSYWIIQNIMRPAFQKNDFIGGINDAVDKIISATKGEYIPSDNSSKNKKITGNSFEFIFYLFAFFMFVVIPWIGSMLARSKSWWAGGIIGFIIGLILLFAISQIIGIIAMILLTPLGLLFDHSVSKNYLERKKTGQHPSWWAGGGGFGGGGGGGFGGFGGGGSGGGGSSGSW